MYQYPRKASTKSLGGNGSCLLKQKNKKNKKKIVLLFWSKMLDLK